MKRVGSPLGFTLTELLIATGLVGLLMMALVAVVVGHVRSRGTMEAVMKLQDDWTRVQFLLDQDIEESIASSNTGGCAPSGNKLTLTVAGTNQPISYYLNGTSLRRCGPAITVTGELSPTITSDDLVAERVSRFEVDLSDSQRPFYELTLTDPTGAT